MNYMNPNDWPGHALECWGLVPGVRSTGIIHFKSGILAINFLHSV